MHSRFNEQAVAEIYAKLAIADTCLKMKEDFRNSEFVKFTIT